MLHNVMQITAALALFPFPHQDAEQGKDPCSLGAGSSRLLQGEPVPKPHSWQNPEGNAQYPLCMHNTQAFLLSEGTSEQQRRGEQGC